MNSLVFHIISGQSFFTGIAFVVVAVTASQSHRRGFGRFTALFFLVGAIFIAISSTPIPYWYYALSITATFAWIISKFVPSWRRWTAAATVALWIIAAAIEIPFHWMPKLSSAPGRHVMIIGDSLTAGIGSDTSNDRWPDLLARQGFLTQDISRAGDTTADALERFHSQEREFSDNAVIIVEIGGNDILDGTPSQEFATDLRALLSEVCSTETQVAMFELPLPPFAHQYGRIQRELAREYHVTLIPKRFLLSVLGADEATLDSIHLSKAGHQRMAELVHEFLGPISDD